MDVRENPKPVKGDLKITASLDQSTPYSGQKVKMSITPSKAVDLPTYGKNLQFQISSPFVGIIAYPSAESQLTQDISSNLSGPWTCDGIVNPNGQDSITMRGMIYDSNLQDSSNPRGALPDVGRGKPVKLQDAVVPRTVLLQSVSSPSQPTVDGTQQLGISARIQDKANSATAITGKFAPLVTDQNGQALSGVAFYSGDNETASTQVSTVSSDGKTIALDTLTSDNQQLKVWVVAATNDNAVYRLNMKLGNDVDAPVGTIVIADLITGEASGYLPGPKVKEASDEVVHVTQDMYYLHFYIPTPEQGALESGDSLVLLVNGQSPSTVPTISYTPNDYVTVFTIPSNDFRLIPPTSDQPTENTVQYVAWRNQAGLPSAPVLSTPSTLWYSIDPGFTQGIPPQTNSKYGAPKIPQTASVAILTANIIAQGLNVEVPWSTDGSDWTPQDKDQITVTFYLNGWDATGAPKPLGTPSLSHVLDQTNDIDGNKRSITLPVPPDRFAEYGQDFKSSGDEPTMSVQYSVVHDGAAPSTAVYSGVFEFQFNTISVGTGIG
ncbi:hypothetical protein B0G57_11737 [Trinickia symbiotica]|uniref:Uncharacterized protein n=1 Tax=Trinickia symbiotica TaxID=863227 RepID=A0A2N7X694_9BURK|nr:hypothetical protein [Trinickia symbiotica]PMS37273.1 hypothetical protein C0Z20_08090 [Trinickia symbiotica]PPK42646.1 hypothetical protein B0G57_11737 [Trinickia symbiotica]